MHIRELASADASCGGKARNLARLIAAGLPVPDGFVVLAGASSDDVTVALEAAAFDGLDGTQLAVRSSSAIEDAAAGAGAGVFESLVDVAPSDVWSAIERVRASADSDAARAYAHRVGPTGLSLAVIVQRFIPGTRITVYTRPPDDATGAAAWVQPSDGEPFAVLRDPLDDSPLDPRVALALAAERAIAATGGADVELVDDGTALWVVQARPIVRAVTRARMRPPAIVLAPLVADGRTWRWDITHNPDPLSPAQAGLVELVERAGIAPWSLRVVGGYLYSAPRATGPSLSNPGSSTSAVDVAHGPISNVDVADIERRMAAALDGPSMSLAEALDRYLAFYRIWANELAPLVSADQREHVEVGARPSSVEATLFAAARAEISEADAIARLGDLSPAWDVAVPTFGETPQLVRDAIARARLVRTNPASISATNPASTAGSTRSTSVAMPASTSGSAPSTSVAMPPSTSVVKLASTSGSAPSTSVARPASTAGSTPASTAGKPASTSGSAPSTSVAKSRSTSGPAPSTSVAMPASTSGPAPSTSGFAPALHAPIADLAERDDFWFARAQLLVRQALRSTAEAQGIDPDDAAWLPLDDLAGGHVLDPTTARRRAAAARAAHARAADWEMPIEVPAPERQETEALRGFGSGGRVTGRVVKFASLAGAIAVGPRDIVVTRAVTPALAVLVVGCAALVSETGGPLDHGAALARELGIPCVVGCVGAFSALADGMIVTVDGAAGTVDA